MYPNLVRFIYKWKQVFRFSNCTVSYVCSNVCFSAWSAMQRKGGGLYFYTPIDTVIHRIDWLLSRQEEELGETESGLGSYTCFCLCSFLSIFTFCRIFFQNEVFPLVQDQCFLINWKAPSSTGTCCATKGCPKRMKRDSNRSKGYDGSPSFVFPVLSLK